MENDMFKILISTDNHLGYKESDPNIGEDSFKAFEKVLQIAVENNVDFLLLGGDLFDANKPTRSTMNRTISLLDHYCLGDKPIQFQYLHTPIEPFRENCINYEDPNINISLPIFAIHGNHDDPTRDNNRGEALSALDMLSSCRLINYFNRSSSVENIQLAPLLVKKGSTKLCIYGLGFIPDERLSRLFEQQKVTFIRPKENVDEWYNIFILHQNGDNGRDGHCIKHSYIPSFIDIVIWGHEHEQFIEPTYSKTGSFRVMQPGSSCITSLIEGEAVDKYVAILQVQNKKIKSIPIHLDIIRPLIYKYIVLSDSLTIDPNLPTAKACVESYLDTYMKTILDECKRNQREKYINKYNTEPPLDYVFPLPLVRLAVVFDPYPALSIQLYGNKYTGVIANPSSLLLIKRKKTSRPLGITSGSNEDISMDNDVPFIEEEAQYNTMARFINENLQKKGGLSILSSTKLNNAVNTFINKETDMFKSIISELITTTDQVCSSSTSLDLPYEDIIASIKNQISEPTDIDSSKPISFTSSLAYSNSTISPTSQYESSITSDLNPSKQQIVLNDDSDSDVEYVNTPRSKRKNTKQTTKVPKRRTRTQNTNMEF